ncbi:MAG: IS256 family transposase [Candidatus Eremiobacteraeota bacterium]|nr:IS256 family transposase [Candidatus Eremiobacteraeota bacterium]
MAPIESTSSESAFPEAAENLVARVVESYLNNLLEEQMAEHLGANRHERTDERTGGYRNGTRGRQLYTRVGPVTLRVPQARDGGFSTDIFQRYQRSEQALVLAILEMYVNGVSTRKVSTITESLCGTSISKSAVSRLIAQLDVRVTAFNERRLDDVNYPFVYVDAMFIKCRHNDRIASKAALIASGVNAAGYREPLGVQIGDSESFTTWEALFSILRKRGLEGVVFVVSDEHAGLVQALRKHFAGATWQRCQVHLQRNLLGHSPMRERKTVADAAKRVFHAADMSEARRQRECFAEMFAKTAPKAVACLEDAFDDAMAVMCLPEKYRKRLRSTNMQERLNEEIRRRERVVRVFPNEDSAVRLIGALLAETAEAWQERVYLDMQEFREWQATQAEERAIPATLPIAV